MLQNYLKEIIEKYSFIDKVEIKSIYFYLFYTKAGAKKFKRIPKRATIPQLQNLLKNIEKDIGVGKYGKPRYGQIFTT